jgi:hypothetical protein
MEPARAAAPPRSLLETGLYVAGSSEQVRSSNLPFTPQYPLWSDGAGKRRWLNLPPGTAIDASRPDAWDFPVGTRLWKEFSQAGRKIETRLMQRRADGSWMYATYLWNDQGTDAILAPPAGALLDIPAAPTGRHEVPASADCLACHEGAAVPVLGASAIQLSRNRNGGAGTSLRDDAPPAAAGSDLQDVTLDLHGLITRELLRDFPASWRNDPPTIPAVSPIEREAFGYLHGNCGHCHNRDGSPAAVQLVLAQSAAAPDDGRRRVLRATLNARSRYRPSGMQHDAVIIAPGRPEASVMMHRMQSRHPLVQMPPLGTLAPDGEALALIRRWIASDLPHHKEHLE